MLRLIALLFCLFLLPIDAFGQGPLLWELQEDIHGGTDIARAVTLSGTAAVIVGNGGEPLPGTDESDFVIQALGKKTGAIEWSDQAFLSIGVVEPIFVTSRQKRAYAVGTLHEDDGRSAFLVRSYDATNGALLWENVWHASQGIDADHPQGIIASPTQVVVVGYGENATGNGLAMLVRAYEPLTGSILWEDRVSQDAVDVIGWTIAANANRVFVAGTTGPAGDVSRDLFLRSYDAASGQLVWETTRQTAMPVRLNLAAGRLFVAGSASGRTYLAAFSAKRGNLLWEDTATASGTFLDIAVNGPRIVGAITSGAGFAVRAYDVTTGALEWQDQPTIPPGFSERVLAVALNDDTVFAAGSSGEDFGNSELMVRAYAAQDGTLLWDDRSHASTQTSAFDLALGKARLFVAGDTSGGSTDLDFLIRAYDVTGHSHLR